MKRVFLTLAALAGLGLAGAVAVVGLGLYNVSAQVGHWPCDWPWWLHASGLPNEQQEQQQMRKRKPWVSRRPIVVDK